MVVFPNETVVVVFLLSFTLVDLEEVPLSVFGCFCFLKKEQKNWSMLTDGIDVMMHRLPLIIYSSNEGSRCVRGQKSVGIGATFASLWKKKDR